MGVRVALGLRKGMALPAPRVAAASNGMVLNAQGLWVYPPGYPLIDLGRAYTPSATTEGSLLAAGVATTGLFAAGVVVKDFWEIFLGGTFLNNSGTSTYTSRIRAYYGAFPILDDTSAVLTSNASVREWSVRLRVLIETLGAAGTGTLRTAAQVMGIDVVQGTGTGVDAIAANVYREQVAVSSGTSSSPALITNAAQDFNVTATHSNATASMTTTLTECIVRYYPQNR